VELATDDIRVTLLENGARYRQNPDFDSMPVVKFFTPDASASWLIVSADPETHSCSSAYVESNQNRIGLSRSES
jgi:hypothetical protein